ncbi:MAG: 23S rRNA (adenine(2503)-C(2))-methyltransferase RlmN [Candidatus Kapabacteria bacterium]|nr:23S rRNA (adenine(2503)-C(2))-methyltransferase RlmN [Candidatus Kapabacteria bacterium]
MRTIKTEALEGKQFLHNYTLPALTALMKDFGLQAFRAEQIFRSLTAGGASSFDELTTLPASLRAQLADLFIITPVTVETTQRSADGTIKFLFSLMDGAKIESVLIPSEMVIEEGKPKRLTLCISTQAGCPLGCSFCATATLKLRRNLETAEIVGQLLAAQRFSELPITNVVFMGMGEPMLNYENVMRAVEIFTHEKSGLLSHRRITLSTAGVAEGIYRMADENQKIKLALSLHATTNGDRKKLMPIANKHSLEDLGNALEYYYRKTKNPVTYEYILFDGINDSELDVRRLKKIAARVPSKVNVIPFHEIEFTNPTGIAATLKPAPKDRFFLFLKRLKEEGVHVMVRSSSGLDIDAACGQLAFSNAHQ